MPSEFLMGLHIAGTAFEGGVFDKTSGKCIASARREVKPDVKGPHQQEIPPGKYSRMLGNLLQDLKKEAHHDWKRITGIGLAAQAGGTMLVDRRNGWPRTPMLLPEDTRCLPWWLRLQEATGSGFWQSLSRRDLPPLGLARAWMLREEQPDLFDEHVLCAGTGEWMFFQLTAEWRQDACQALQHGCYDVRESAISGQGLQHAGLESALFAALRNEQKTTPVSPDFAREWGFSESVHVAGPYSTQEAGFLALSQMEGRVCQASLDISWSGNFEIGPSEQGASPSQWLLPSPRQTDHRLVAQPVMTGNATWDWALKQFLAKHLVRAAKWADTVFDERPLPRPGLCALPWLDLPNPLRAQWKGGACLLGMGCDTDKEEMLRAVAAGLCFEFERMFRPVQQDQKIDRLVLSGRGNNGPFFQGMLAALFEPLPVFVVKETDLLAPRGSLHAFDTCAARCEVEKVTSPARLDREALASARTLYADAFEKVCGNVQTARAWSGGKE